MISLSSLLAMIPGFIIEQWGRDQIYPALVGGFNPSEKY